jgi:methionine-rich copper-binding protein CopC
MSPAGRGRHRVIRRVSGLLGALTAAGIVLVAVAPAASAHATPLFTSPAADSAVSASPKAITLTFNQAVTLAGRPMTLASAGGNKIALGPARQSGAGSVITAPVTTPLPDGVYTVSWQVISSDGDLVGSQFRFAVGPAPASLGSGRPRSCAGCCSPGWPPRWAGSPGRLLPGGTRETALPGCRRRGQCRGRCSARSPARGWAR